MVDRNRLGLLCSILYIYFRKREIIFLNVFFNEFDEKNNKKLEKEKFEFRNTNLFRKKDF